MLFLKLQLDIIYIIFIDIQDDQKLRPVKRHLPADLAADGPSASGDQDNLALKIAADFLHIQLHRLSSQQILYADVPQHRYIYLLIDHLIDSRQDLDLAGRLLTNLQEFLLILILQCRDCDNNLFNTIFLCHLGNVFFFPDDGDSLQIGSDLLRVIIYDTWDFSV